MRIKEKTLLLAITFSITLFCIINAQTDSIKQLPCLIKEKQMINHITKALLDSDIMIGVFDKYSFKHRLQHFRSGEIPEIDKNYLMYMTSANLIKLGTHTIIKGDFDSLIFIKYPAFSFEHSPLNSNPVFHMGSSWLLMLEKAFDKDGTAKMEWVGKLDNRKLFNENTTFLNAFETYYALCYQWPEDKIKSPDIIMIDEGMIADLSSIAKILELKNKDKKIEMLNLMLKKNECLNGCSQLIIQKILLTIIHK